MADYTVSCRKIDSPGGSPISWNVTNIKHVKNSLYQVMTDLDFTESEIKGQTVLIHPNLVRPHRDRPASFTDPRVIIALAEIFKDCGAKHVSVGENPGFGFPSACAFEESGLTEAFRHMDVKIRHFDQEKWVTVENPEGRLYRKIKVASSVLETDLLINVPKLKTHMLTRVSLCIKNLLGIISDDDRQIYHRNDIADKVVDLNFVRSPDLNIIDGLWAMEGQAPFNGDTIKEYNWLIAGRHGAAVDAVTCQLIGLRPEEVPHVHLGCHRLLKNWNGLSDVNITGSKLPDDLRVFKRPVLSSMAQFRNVNCIECGVCRGCLSAIRHSLDWLNASGELDAVGPVTIVSGRSVPNHTTLETWEGQLILFGNCASEFMFFDPKRRQDFIFIPGCAPHVLDLAAQLRALTETKK